MTDDHKDLRLYAIVSAEALALMKGVRGKLTAQTGHAFLHAYWDAEERFPEDARAYRYGGSATKITLVVPTTAELQTIYDNHKDLCGATHVTDKGRTVFAGPTITCVGLGPIEAIGVGPDVKELKSLT